MCFMKSTDVLRITSLSFIGLIGFNFSVLAATSGVSNNTPNFFPYTYGFKPFVTVDAGMGTANANNGSHTDIPPGSFNFSGSDNHSTQMLGLTVGVEKQFTPQGLGLLGWQLGISVQQYGGMKGRGNAEQGISGALSHFDYSYNIKTTAWFLSNEVFGTFSQRYHPYGLVGLGQANNTASNYTATPQEADTDIPVSFGSKTTSSFAYQLGLGLEVDITNSLRAGIGLRYTDLGKVSLGAGTVNDQAFPGSSLSQSQMKNKSVLLDISYLF